MEVRDRVCTSPGENFNCIGRASAQLQVSNTISDIRNLARLNPALLYGRCLLVDRRYREIRYQNLSRKITFPGTLFLMCY